MPHPPHLPYPTLPYPTFVTPHFCHPPLCHPPLHRVCNTVMCAPDEQGVVSGPNAKGTMGDVLERATVARRVARERMALYEPLRAATAGAGGAGALRLPSGLPQPPSLLASWRRLWRYEESNPQRLSEPALHARMAFTFEQASLAHKSRTSLAHTSRAQVSHTSLSHKSRTQVSHTSLAHKSLTHKSLTQVSRTQVSHTSPSHKSLTHASHTSLSHTSLSHTSLSHTGLSLTHASHPIPPTHVTAHPSHISPLLLDVTQAILSLWRTPQLWFEATEWLRTHGHEASARELYGRAQLVLPRSALLALARASFEEREGRLDEVATFLIRRHTPFPPYVAPRFPHMS